MGTSPWLGLVPELRSTMVHPPPRRTWRSLAIVSLFLLAAVTLPPALAPKAAAAGTTYVSGNACAGSLTPTWVNTTAYVLYGNVTVPAGCILTIEPGTAIRADPQVRLYVDGMLEANGTSTNRISFDANVTNQAWGGVQINKTSRSSYLQYATLHMVGIGVRAVGTPLFWGPFFTSLNIDHAVVGAEFDGSNGTLWSSRISSTTMAVHVKDGGYGGYPIIVGNTITTVASNPAIAILSENAVQPTIQSNGITWVNGTDGANGAPLDLPGHDGAPAVGILVTGGSWPIVAGNTVSQVRGGRGGNGGNALLGNGGRGGRGGDAYGIVMGNGLVTRAQTNTVTGIVGGHGGTGGGGTAGFTGGPGGAGGTAVGVEAVNSTTQGWWFYNHAIGITGGSAGDGGSGSAQGAGGAGGAAYGHFFMENVAGNASNNEARNLYGGYGGNGSVGGVGGDVGGLWMARIIGTGLLGTNQVQTLVGGVGGAGNQPVARGGNATAILALGDDGYFNITTIRGNVITGVTGGIGGVGGNGGSDGGGATAIGAIYSQLVSSGNTVQTITGGQGGSTAPGRTNGQGGTATGLAVALGPSFSSSLDMIQSVVRGLPGSGGLNPSPAQGIGFYVTGNATFTSVSSLTNDTFASIGDADLFLDNYTRTTTLNTTFASSKLYVGPAANLTVQNFLAVKVLWPNNITTVWGSWVVVTDNGAEAYNKTAVFGYPKWIVLTNRVYTDSTVPRWNTTVASVNYQAYTFAKNPRTVNMTGSQTQYFTMVDTTPPTTSMTSLPTYEATRTFTVRYQYSDGFGVGVKNITVWERVNGASWVSYNIYNATFLGNGQFSFTAPSDGTFEFAATAVDKAGNQQTPVPPSANQTWTIVDTTKPSSSVATLPAWETSLSFLVSWGPTGGTTDIASYAVQYNSTGSWVTWLSATTLTSSTFTATSQGAYQFRSLATDRAGNVETKTGNDTWTIVDTIVPTSAVGLLPQYETVLSFGITWGPTGGTADIASYAIQVSTDGGSWVTWFSGATNGSATFNGLDGHRYAFRSLATDGAGNTETKAGNDTWTLVDTTPPASLVSVLPHYETSLAFGVSWGPSPGVTDIATYRIQYDHGSGWTDWLAGTTITSAVFDTVALGIPSPQGAYAFRSLATDRAGNVETKTGNDTWTIVDTIVPTSAVAPLAAYETTLSFAVSWGATGGTSDVASYKVEVSTDGGSWVTWLSGASNSSASFQGLNGHRYAFRSLATDYAGNVETKAGNDTWTIVDVTPPTSAVQALPAYETSLVFQVTWGATGATSDAVSYRIQYNDGTGWVTWLDTSATTMVFTATAQGVYQFRSLATDRAGNVETKTGNDTWTIVDTVAPESGVSPVPAYKRVLAFTVGWGPVGGTSDIASYTVEYSVDGGAWITWLTGVTNTTATFTGADGHRYAFRSLATDRAGNVETKTGNDTWTVVDTTPPTSTVTALPPYETVTSFTLSWSATGSTSDVASFAIQVSRDGGAWTTWLSGVTNTSALYSGVDGHRYAFRSLATDRAGNVETKAGNDTWTIVDTARPTVLAQGPEGTGVNTGIVITITFSEPMDQASVVQAFSVTPAIDGAYSWNAAGTVLTFTPSRPFLVGTSYTVVIDTGARDLAGNTMASAKTFSFSTAGAAAGPLTFNLMDWWPLFLLVAVVAVAAAVFLLRRRGTAAERAASKPTASAVPAPATEIDDVFLLYKDGILIKHETLRLRPEVDTDILSGMLTAVQQFVKDSFQSEYEGELNEITVGQMHLHIGRGKWLILAARVAGGDVTTMNEQIRAAIQDMEDHHWDQIEDWDGDMALAKVLGPYLKKLIRGDYA